MLMAFETRIFELIDQLLEDGTDDELFASSYLQGHLTVALAQAELAGESSIEQLVKRVEASLDNAFNQRELVPADQRLVSNLWVNLYFKATDNQQDELHQPSLDG